MKRVRHARFLITSTLGETCSCFTIYENGTKDKIYSELINFRAILLAPSRHVVQNQWTPDNINIYHPFISVGKKKNREKSVAVFPESGKKSAKKYE